MMHSAWCRLVHSVWHRLVHIVRGFTRYPLSMCDLVCILRKHSKVFADLWGWAYMHPQGIFRSSASGRDRSLHAHST